jgi:hypothetical protein
MPMVRQLVEAVREGLHRRREPGDA